MKTLNIKKGHITRMNIIPLYGNIDKFSAENEEVNKFHTYCIVAMVSRVVNKIINFESFEKKKFIKVNIFNEIHKCLITSIKYSSDYQDYSIIELQNEQRDLFITIYVFHYTRMMDAYYNPDGYELEGYLTV